ncbi:MAG: peptide-methionine (R)-S-oxide reductase MsrB [Rhodanobacteraceae bacterium]
MDRRQFLTGSAGLLGFGALALIARGAENVVSVSVVQHPTFVLTDAQWRQRLGPERYAILRQAGTEPAFSSSLNHEHRAGVFHCAGCELPLYSSKTKFDSGTGWPSFWKPLPNAVARDTDTSFLMTRTEIRCRRCAGHLGHVFHDGPPPTGLRYCMNGLALRFVPGATA